MSELFGFASTLNGDAVQDSIGFVHAELLEKTVLNRNKRKAKGIFLTCAEFILSVFTIWQTIAIERGSTHRHTRALAVVALVYTFVLACAVLFHARYFLVERGDKNGNDRDNHFTRSNNLERVVPNDTNDSDKVEYDDIVPAPDHALKLEKAYSKTNNYPLVDGFLEISCSFRFLPIRQWWLPILTWTTFIGLVTYLTVNLILFQEPPGTLTSSILASVQLYRITVDLCEYWVCTHYQFQTNQKGPPRSQPPRRYKRKNQVTATQQNTVATRSIFLGIPEGGNDKTGNADDSESSFAAGLDCEPLQRVRHSSVPGPSNINRSNSPPTKDCTRGQENHDSDNDNEEKPQAHSYPQQSQDGGNTKGAGESDPMNRWFL